MAIGHEDVAVRRYGHVGRSIERVRPIASDPSGAERHQHPAVLTELEDLMADALPSLRIRRPEIPLRVQGGTVWPYEHALAPAVHEPARRVVVEHGRHPHTFRDAVVREAALKDPQTSIGVDLDPDRLSPGFHTVR